MAKVRFDYSLVGLEKKEGIVTFDNVKVVEKLTPHALSIAANYGLFVAATRSLAGHEKDSVAEKKELIKGVIDWYLDDCPQRTKGTTGIASTQSKVDAIMADITGLTAIMDMSKDKAAKAAIQKMIDGKMIEVESLKKKLAEAQERKALSGAVAAPKVPEKLSGLALADSIINK